MLTTKRNLYSAAERILPPSVQLHFSPNRHSLRAGPSAVSEREVDVLNVIMSPVSVRNVCS